MVVEDQKRAVQISVCTAQVLGYLTIPFNYCLPDQGAKNYL
jgi:hypothetical protein